MGALFFELLYHFKHSPPNLETAYERSTFGSNAIRVLEYCEDKKLIRGRKNKKKRRKKNTLASGS